MVKRLTESRKNQIFEEHKSLLYLLYLYGNGGIMLRQQLVLLASRILNKHEIEIEVALSRLLKSGLLRSSSVFANSRHTMICLKKYVLSIFLEKPSRDCYITALSPNTTLYSIYKTQLYLNNLNKSDLTRTPIILRKNQAKDLYTWYGDLVETTLIYKNEADRFHKLESSPKEYFCIKYCMDEIFNFNHFLASNFLLKDVSEVNNKNILQLYFLDLNCITIKKFYSLVKCLLKMFDRYTANKFERIEISILFQNRSEMHAFKNGWNRNKFVNIMIAGRVNPYMADCCHIFFESLDLDLKYHIYRELSF